MFTLFIKYKRAKIKSLLYFCTKLKKNQICTQTNNNTNKFYFIDKNIS